MITLKIGLAQTRQTADPVANAETVLRFLEDGEDPVGALAWVVERLQAALETTPEGVGDAG